VHSFHFSPAIDRSGANAQCHDITQPLLRVRALTEGPKVVQRQVLETFLDGQQLFGYKDRWR